MGIALLNALSRSRFLLPKDDPELFDFEKVEERYDAWIRELLQLYGYTSKRRALQDLMLCCVKREADEIAIEPTQHTKLEEWEGLGPDDTVRVPAVSPPVAIGSAVRKALDRCY